MKQGRNNRKENIFDIRLIAKNVMKKGGVGSKHIIVEDSTHSINEVRRNESFKILDKLKSSI